MGIGLDTFLTLTCAICKQDVRGSRTKSTPFFTRGISSPHKLFDTHTACECELWSRPKAQYKQTLHTFIPYTFIIIMYNNTYAVQQCIVYIEAVLCNCYTAKSVPFEMLHKFSFTAYFVAHHKPQSVT
jgi:hypothetical protein